MLEFGSGFGSVFFDDSRHDRCNFALGAFVCAHGAAIDKLPKLLVAHGLTPYVDEFKSGTIMRNNPRLRDLREEFLRLLQFHCLLAVVISPPRPAYSLGWAALSHVPSLCEHPLLKSERCDIYFDQGLFPSVTSAATRAESLPISPSTALHFEQDSRAVLGLQLADLAAHAAAMMLVEELEGARKIFSGENPASGESFDFTLQWKFWQQLRRNFLSKPMEESGERAGYAQLAPYGLHIDPGCPEKVRAIAEKRFGSLFLGCIW